MITADKAQALRIHNKEVSANMKKLLKKQGGFTLLELLIVIVIIGILALIIVPGLASGPKRARDAQRKSDLRAVKNALETYYNDKNVYPAPAGNGTTTAWTNLTALLTPDYLPTVPSDPKSGSTTGYVYGANTGSTSYVIEGNMENTTDAQINDKNGAAGYNGTYNTPSNYPQGYAVKSVN
jgi:type II secretion system protein G